MLRSARRVIPASVVLAVLCGMALADDKPKVVIIGFDGADAGLVRRWIDEGELPNLAALEAEGSFAPLVPTNPPQTPVSWSSFATGLDPGQTEIFDFLKRNPADYLPDFAMMSETRKKFLFGERNPMLLGLMGGAAVLLLVFALLLLLPLGWRARVAAALLAATASGLAIGFAAGELIPIEVPGAINNRRGVTMWELAAAAGMRARIIRVPATFPAEPIGDGQMLSGLGVPDMRGRVGTPSFYTSDSSVSTGDNEFSLELIRLPARRGTIETRVIGPRNKPFYEYPVARLVSEADPAERQDVRREARRALDDRGVASVLYLPLRLEVTDTTATIDLGGRRETLRVGEWSEWFELDFDVNALIDTIAPLQGLGRFKLLQLEPELQLYFSPLNFHPDCHAVDLSWPTSYSEDLHDRFGLYKTIGWALDTWSLPSGVGDEDLFLEDMRFTVDQYEKMMEGLLTDNDADLFVQIFYFTDRIGHLFWQFIDPGHPLYDPAAAERYAPEMLAAYKRMDEIVGKARRLVGPETLFLVASDHGFSSFRRGVSYNNWLVEKGLMVLKHQPSGPATLEKLFDTRDLLAGVDWSRTKAYALGLGSIYVNLIGRERNGIVLPGPEYEAVREQIKSGLEQLVDPATGRRPVERVWLREEIYSEFDAALIPDLRVSNSLDYRVSWQTSLGGFGEETIEDNLKAWSGDHCSLDPSLVPGIFFANRPINTPTPRMIDIMPTVLDALGLETPPEVRGRSLF